MRSKHQLLLKEDGMEYGQVTTMLGAGRMSVACHDGVARIATLRGALQRRVHIIAGDIVLLDLSADDNHQKADIVHKYSDGEVVQLKEIIDTATEANGQGTS